MKRACLGFAGLWWAGLLASGCGYEWTTADADNDGFSAADGDCWDAAEGPAGAGLTGAEIHPGAPDEPYDGIDADCAGNDDYDLDGDGYVPAGIDPGLETAGLAEPEHLGDGDCWDDPTALPDEFSAINGFSQPPSREVFPGAANTFYDGIDQGCAGSSDFDADADSHDSLAWPDRAGAVGDDCLDSSEEEYSYNEGNLPPDQIFPGATELCDDSDNDCDAAVDADDADVDLSSAYAVYRDADEDSYGETASKVISCGSKDGYVGLSGDCDDADETAYPSAPEYCDDADDDCDGAVDDDAVDALAYYADADEDSYGDPVTETVVCDAPTGYVLDSSDCDDGDAGVSPGAPEHCDGVDTDCSGTLDDDYAVDAPTWYQDGDGDGYGDGDADACEQPAGYAAEPGDCDDADPGVNPGALEYCDEVDEDCNGQVDDDYAVDAGTWYDDADGDGYGDPDDDTTACDPPAGHVADDEDCDDGAFAINPGADEYCDGQDDDCNGQVDDDYAVDADTWYRDADGDTYGTSATTKLACSEPAGYEADDDDCNDASSSVNPGEAEIAGDNVDQDCDGKEDCYPDLDGDGYRTSAVVASGDADCSDAGEALSALPDGDCDDADGDRSPGELEVCEDGVPDNDCDDSTTCRLTSTTLASADRAWIGEDKDDYAGSAVSAEGDLDGDGADDLVIGAYGESAVYVDNGPVAAGADIDLGSAIKLTGVASSYTGWSLASNGDENGDGDDDLLVGAYRGGASTHGIAYLLRGPVAAGGSLTALADASFTGASSAMFTGYSLTFGGDLTATADGEDELVIGTPRDDTAASDAGAVYLIYGPAPSGSLTLPSAADVAIYGESAQDYAGSGVARAGDTDGDGRDDLAVGAYLNDEGGTNSGAVYLLEGPLSSDVNLVDVAAKWTGTNNNDEAGYGISAGDANNDGFNDLLVGTYLGDDAYLLLGPIPTGGDLAAADAVLAGDNNSNFGYAVSLARDLDGDGYHDALVGAPQADVAGTDDGAVYLFHGPLSGSLDTGDADAVFSGEATNDRAGFSVSAGDVSGDGAGDVAIGAWKQAGGGTNAGAAYLLLGIGD